MELSVGAPEPDQAGIYSYDLVVDDDLPIYAAMIAVGPTGLKSAASNEVFRPALPVAPPPAPSPPPASPPPPPAAPSPAPAPNPPLPAPGSPPASGLSVYRVNVGGPAFIDQYDRIWNDDWNFREPCACSTPDVNGPDVTNTDRPPLYWRERTNWDAENSMTYNFPLTSGDYLVRLHFAETAGYGRGPLGEGERQFDVLAEGAVVLEALDIAAEAGPDRALVKELVVSVSDGALSLDFKDIGRGQPRISAIEVATLAAESPAPNLFSLYQINAGGPEFVDPLDRVWESDFAYVQPCACSTPDSDGVDVANTDLPELYRRERTQWNLGEPMAYEIPVEPGEYVVRLHFAETAGYGRGPLGEGERQFDVRAEGAVVFAGLDIAYEAGADHALVKEFSVDVDDGALSLGFDHIGRGQPRISAIEVLAVE